MSNAAPPPAPPTISVTPTKAGTLASLLRLWPNVKPIFHRLALSAFFALVASVCGLLIPLIIQRIIDGPVTDKDLSALWPLGFALVGVGIFEGLLYGVRRILAARPTMRVEAKLRQDLYARLQALPISFHDHYSSGQLLSRAISDLNTIRMFLAFTVIFLMVNLSTFVIGVAILLSLSWQLGLIFVAMALPLIVLCFVFEVKYKVLARRSQDQVGDLATQVEESVLGIRILKSFGRSAHVGRTFLKDAADLRGTELAKVRVFGALWAVIIALPEIAIGIALLLGVNQVADGTLSAGSLVAFFSVAMMLRWPIDSLGWLLASTNETAAASERYFEVMDEPMTVTSPAAPAQLPAAGSAGRLVFEDVSFRFPDATGENPDALRGLDLVLEPGRTVAVVGATGSGKTTLTALVNRMYDVTGGRITIDGIDIRDLALTDLRTAVSVAFEEPILFSVSAAENVRFGRPDASDEEVRQALQIAQADFVHDLPWGLDTRLGEQGLSLSGGQRQRLALARAVLGHPRVLVLDDPLSALDIHTEAAVEAALRSVLTTTTTLLIAHRASTVMLAEKVALLSGGRIAAIGTHSELMATSTEYRDLLSSAEDEAHGFTARTGGFAAIPNDEKGLPL